MSDDITRHDLLQRRCPMLGHDIPFGYCRAPAAALPCRRIFDCWWESFDIEAFIREHYGPDDIARMLAPRQEKLATIVELIEKARTAARRPPDAPQPPRED